MSSVPRVSVIMAVHNGEAYLAEAIESVLDQTFRDFEFLIHDDGSTDNTLAILQRYASQDGRITITSGANQGLARSLNHLIDRARGDLVARMDADDVCLTERFELQVRHLEREPKCVVLGGGITVMDDAGRVIHDLSVPLNHELIDRNNLRGVTSICHPTVMMRRDAFQQCGGYDIENLAAEDLDLWLRMAEIGRIANLSDMLLKYRVHGQSISGSKRELQRAMAHHACKAAWARRGLNGISFDYSEWRMADTPESRQEFFLRYGWQAWNSGYRDTWRHYAWRSVALAPLSRKAWVLLIMGSLKRPARRAKRSA